MPDGLHDFCLGRLLNQSVPTQIVCCDCDALAVQLLRPNFSWFIASNIGAQRLQSTCCSNGCCLVSNTSLKTSTLYWTFWSASDRTCVECTYVKARRCVCLLRFVWPRMKRNMHVSFPNRGSIWLASFSHERRPIARQICAIATLSVCYFTSLISDESIWRAVQIFLFLFYFHLHDLFIQIDWKNVASFPVFNSIVIV